MLVYTLLLIALCGKASINLLMVCRNYLTACQSLKLMKYHCNMNSLSFVTERSTVVPAITWKLRKYEKNMECSEHPRLLTLPVSMEANRALPRQRSYLGSAYNSCFWKCTNITNLGWLAWGIAARAIFIHNVDWMWNIKWND